ncbi:transmembrane and coiled-coil domain-containing protein 4 isoform X2 [Varanus komodoensis]|uniref:transmembrane and coiled-coil domain-containing protein 4 isoform X2 n=1 Tax=Varanus komodoensis TaxID=61221 RepID=UPI001CF7B6F6|nr:transmembrane and coiled-coil domain-containing protein 4 isoform X2 [Varanus komodoensis]
MSERGTRGGIREAPARTAEALRKKKERRKKLKRYLLIGLATVGGGTVIGLTGGLAAPLVATGAAAVIGSAGAAALGSAAGIAVMASLFGAAGAGLTGYKMKKRVGAIEEFEFLPLTEGKQLHIAIAVTGWLSPGKYGSFVTPWGSLLQSREQYCLAWESKYLVELGNAFNTLLNGLVNVVGQEALKYTVLSGIVTALALPASLLTVASVIDNPWGVCLHRSAEVGKHLAQILLGRHQGRRPVTLVGFSLGARVIYFCLQEMAKEEDCRGIVEDVVLLGAPVEGDATCWKPITKVVSGKIVNGYCRGDWLLSLVYRTSSAQLNVAGLQPVNLDDRRMVNVDLSSVVSRCWQRRGFWLAPSTTSEWLPAAWPAPDALGGCVLVEGGDKGGGGGLKMQAGGFPDGVGRRLGFISPFDKAAGPLRKRHYGKQEHRAATGHGFHPHPPCAWRSRCFPSSPWHGISLCPGQVNFSGQYFSQTPRSPALK